MNKKKNKKKQKKMNKKKLNKKKPTEVSAYNMHAICRSLNFILFLFFFGRSFFLFTDGEA